MNAATKKAYLISLLLTGVFVLLTAGFTTYALLFEYSAALGHFSSDAFSSVFLPLLYILAVVVFFVFGFLFQALLAGEKARATLPGVFASGFAAITTLTYLVSFALSFFGATLSPLSTVFGVLLLVLGALTVIYFILSASTVASATHTALLRIAAVLFCLVYVFYVYFDLSFALNSPIKIFDQITVIFVMFFLLAESRMHFGAIRMGILVPVAMSAILFSAAGSIGGLIYSAVEERPLFHGVTHDFLLFGFFLYVLSRLVSFLLPPLAGKAAPADEDAPFFEAEESFTPPKEPVFSQERFNFDSVEDKKDDAASTEETNTEDGE